MPHPIIPSPSQKSGGTPSIRAHCFFSPLDWWRSIGSSEINWKDKVKTHFKGILIRNLFRKRDIILSLCWGGNPEGHGKSGWRGETPEARTTVGDTATGAERMNTRDLTYAAKWEWGRGNWWNNTLDVEATELVCQLTLKVYCLTFLFCSCLVSSPLKKDYLKEIWWVPTSLRARTTQRPCLISLFQYLYPHWAAQRWQRGRVGQTKWGRAWEVVGWDSDPVSFTS